MIARRPGPHGQRLRGAHGRAEDRPEPSRDRRDGGSCGGHPRGRRLDRAARAVNRSTSRPLSRTSLVDPTGCGDAYRAGLLHGLARGWDVGQVRPPRLRDGLDQDRAPRRPEPPARRARRSRRSYRAAFGEVAPGRAERNRRRRDDARRQDVWPRRWSLGRRMRLPALGQRRTTVRTACAASRTCASAWSNRCAWCASSPPETGVGAAAGAVIGGVAGSHVGGGSGQIVGAIAGAVLGGLLGPGDRAGRQPAHRPRDHRAPGLGQVHRDHPGSRRELPLRGPRAHPLGPRRHPRHALGRRRGNSRVKQPSRYGHGRVTPPDYAALVIPRDEGSHADSIARRAPRRARATPGRAREVRQ